MEDQWKAFGKRDAFSAWWRKQRSVILMDEPGAAHEPECRHVKHFVKQIIWKVLYFFPLLPHQCTVDCGIWNGVECKVWSVKKVGNVVCRVWSGDCEVWSAKCKVESVKCQVWSVKCRV